MLIFVVIVLAVVLAAIAALYATRDNSRTGLRLAVLVTVAGVLLLFVVPIMLAID